VAEAQQVRTIDAHVHNADKLLNHIAAIHYLPGGKTLLSAGGDGTVKLWDVASGKALKTFSHQGPVRCLSVSPDGKSFVSARATFHRRLGKKVPPGPAHEVRWWDIQSGESRVILARDDNSVTSLATSPDGKRLAAAGANGTIETWDLAGMKPTALFNDHKGSVQVVFAPDGKLLASASEDGTVKLWDLAANKLQSTLRTDLGSARAVAFSPDGKLLAFSQPNSDKRSRVTVVDIATGKVRCVLPAGTGDVRAILFSPDGTLIAFIDHKTFLLFLMSGARPTKLADRRPEESVVGGGHAFSPDGKTWVTASHDGVLRLWDVEQLAGKNE
jgi:WD40 repeat protein